MATNATSSGNVAHTSCKRSATPILNCQLSIVNYQLPKHVHIGSFADGSDGEVHHASLHAFVELLHRIMQVAGLDEHVLTGFLLRPGITQIPTQDLDE